MSAHLGVVPRLLSGIVDSADVDRWFGEYLNAFAACGRGESQASSLLAYYGVPLLLSTDDGFVALTTGDDVASMAQRQVARCVVELFQRGTLRAPLN